MVHNGILMETIVISVMVSFSFYCFHFYLKNKVDTMKSLQTQNMI